MNRIQTALEIVAILNDTTVEEIQKELLSFLYSADPEDIVLAIANIINRKALTI